VKVAPEPKHVAFRDDLVAVLRRHGGALEASEMLALAAHLVGQIIALQDQQTMSPERAMEIVARNIEQGNSEILSGLLDSQGRA
jgi:hypothetical protein